MHPAVVCKFTLASLRANAQNCSDKRHVYFHGNKTHTSLDSVM